MKKICLVLSLVLVGGYAQALVELRGSYTLLTVTTDPSSTADSFGVTLPSLKVLGGIGGDVIVTPPLFPVGVGLRYENLNVSGSAGGNEASLDYQRTALLVNYRFIDTFAFLGAIGSLGFSHSSNVKIKVSGMEDSFSSSSGTSYSIGVEGGVHLIGFLIGAEAGFANNTVKGGKSNLGNDFKDLDMSGTYAKILLGFAF